MTETRADIGVYGGSGFYELLADVEQIKVETPYGPPSDKICLGTLNGKRVAFLPRHGSTHSLPPHMIPYRANAWAMKELGVSRIIGPAAVGSLQAHIKPGDFVVCDQFVDRTSGRKDTFFDGPDVAHIMGANPYCETLRGLAADICRSQGITVHDAGTMVVVNGPRFSTTAESRWYTSMGWDVINMTGYPEVILSRELGMCYVNISLITDWDAGVVGMKDTGPVTANDVGKVLQANNAHVREVILEMIERISIGACDECDEAMLHARM
jgi:5'-methylthioadenosine phosphorylase